MTDKPDAKALLKRNRGELEAALAQLDSMQAQVEAAANAIIKAIRGGRKILVAGNGGSAAEAQHFSSELVGRFMLEREGIPAMCLHGDTSAITAIGNDYGFDQIFARQVQAHARDGDVLVLLSTSGASSNLVIAADTAKRLEVVTIGLLGQTRRDLHDLVDISIEVPSSHQPTVQEMHLFLVHSIAELVEAGL